MVSDTKDMLDRDDADPNILGQHSVATKKIILAQQIAQNGEAILDLDDGTRIEVHGHDTHFYQDQGVLMTESVIDGDDAESWVFGENIVRVSRH